MNKKKKNNELTAKEQADKSRELAKIDLKKYITYATPFLSIGFLIIILFWSLDIKYKEYVGIIVLSAHGIVLITYLIFDSLPARKIRKSNFQISGHNISKQQAIVFYNAMKIKTIVRGIFNLIWFLILLLPSILFIIL
ncbi:MAG: hypothetical protein NC236_00115 [Mycoplasma sp.]|nr:hypothetical protein [Mycoplasma sp.]